MKVVSPSDRRRTRAASAVIALLAALSVLGSGSIGSGSAARATTLDSALGPSGATTAPVLEPVSATSVTMRTASLSQPSGLAALEAEASGRRTVTTAFRSARTSTARVRPAHPATTKKVVRRGSWRKARVSWYGPGFYGRTMAGGGKLTPKSMVVAHRSLPFGTKIEFSYRGRTCIAVVRDRGPFVRGRTFDLGPGTAKALRFSGVGTVRWRIVK